MYVKHTCVDDYFFHSLRNAMPSGDNVKPIDQSTAASTRTDPYVSLLKEEIILTISPKSELNASYYHCVWPAKGNCRNRHRPRRRSSSARFVSRRPVCRNLQNAIAWIRVQLKCRRYNYSVAVRSNYLAWRIALQLSNFPFWNRT